MAKPFKIAFVGSRGIPAKYGGNEVFTEQIAEKMLEMGYEVYVTCESNKFHRDEYNGIKRFYTPSVQGRTLTIPYINDIISTMYLLLKCPSIDLICYVAPPGALFVTPIPRLMGKKIIINTDGIEWKRLVARKQFTSPFWKVVFTLVSWGLWLEERMDTKLAHIAIADSRAIKDHLKKVHGAKNVVYISYGARTLLDSNTPSERVQEILNRFGLTDSEYYLTVARIVAENNIHKEIEGFNRSKSSKKFVVVGNFNDRDTYTKHLFKLKENNSKIVLLDPIYDEEVLGVLRKCCCAYVHAYEVGGTNPSLLEQMLFKKPIVASDVPFHREVLQDGGIYFKDEDELANCIQKLERGEFDLDKLYAEQIRRLEEEYNWEHVSEQYDSLFRDVLGPSG